MPPDRSVPALLALRSRGEVKEAGAWLDGEGRATRRALVAAARARGVELPDDAADWSGKRLLRACLDRAGRAQVRSNPLHVDEGFTCVACGGLVPPGGRRPRDHCPWCLVSVHLDVVPGDRAAGCGGWLRPTGFERKAGTVDLVYRCERCGAIRKNRVLDDVEVPDRLDALPPGMVPGPPGD